MVDVVDLSFLLMSNCEVIVCGLMVLDQEARGRERLSSLWFISDWQCGHMMWSSEAILSVMRHDDTGVCCVVLAE
ncbi:unnamed protein product [Schistosoma rodhaini]|uniref:Secreted protein n=2 Tax=Schistosoma mansoni TaxID=6183 RepID=C4QF92_SCHMA|nr:hypothetical protein Smp_111340.1 [Schistosoma mansoni]CAH8513404.1 unnamed protein product [Schistosoma rodhaini]CAH8513420.1 unnamed protein product [Schistosoma rodhaini]CAH8513436.1 unnamed protein product [Schistosoma rodhaini]CAH8513453.1 unnamed protein product [Schistosoma rodhaini]CAH8513470.1 unnamed protein product [Schistosoma rodhaini]|eukprot:XP_018645253.1 hypothetical protein Smp_111340.1 [Schistosoma mansoni]